MRKVLSKSEFVRTFMGHKNVERLEIRISPGIRFAIKKISDLSESKYIKQAIAEKLFRDGGRIGQKILDNWDYGEMEFNVGAARPYTSCRRRCFYRDNY